MLWNVRVEGQICNNFLFCLINKVRNPDTGGSCWVQIGIVSWGWGCGQNYTINGKTLLFPGYYASVLSGIDWIKRGLDQSTFHMKFS